jgi:hypothetical protein
MTTTIPIWTSLLGTVPDTVIAYQYDTSVREVRAARRAAGIPGVGRPRAPKPPPPPPRQRLDASTARPWDGELGTRTDAEIARAWGVPASTVRGRRLCLGIPRYGARKPPQLPDEDQVLAHLARVGAVRTPSSERHRAALDALVARGDAVFVGGSWLLKKK